MAAIHGDPFNLPKSAAVQNANLELAIFDSESSDRVVNAQPSDLGHEVRPLTEQPIVLLTKR